MGSNIDERVMEGEDIPIWAASLPVPNVQEMVRRDPLHIPDRYIRNQEDTPKNGVMSRLSSEIPVIDLSLLSNGQKEELKKLDLACKDWGFFQVVNHGVEKEVMQSMKDAAAGFFELPLEEKNKYSMAPNDIQGYGHAYVVSEEQELDWSDALILLIYPFHYRRHEFWPTTPSGFKEIIEAYSKEVGKVAERLLGFLSVIMGMDRDAILRLHKEVTQALRVNYYPTCSMPDEIWSNGKYKSIEHSAVTNKNKARIYFASFVVPHDDGEIEPLDHMIDSQHALRMYKKVKYGDYLRQSMKKKMEGKAHTKMAKNEI